jgi:hypothetical protein
MPGLRRTAAVVVALVAGVRPSLIVVGLMVVSWS